MGSFILDVKYACRMLGRKPGFTILAVLTLAFGISANVATYSVVHAVLLRPLPFTQPEELVRLFDDYRGSNAQDVGMSALELWDFQQRSGVFQDLAGLFPTDADVTGGDHPERIEILATSGNYFTMLGVKTELGEAYTLPQATLGFNGQIVISDGLWHREFGADPKVIGRQLRLDNDLYTIVGVTPPDFHHPGRTLESEVDAWASTGFAAYPFTTPLSRSRREIPRAIGRLKPGLTVAQAQAQLHAFAAHQRQEFSTDYPAAENWAPRLVPLQQDLVGDVRTELLVLFAAVAFVLLICCVNLATFLLARASGRQREIAIRLAMGAGRARLIRQLLTESVLLATLAGGMAVAIVFGLKNFLLHLAPSNLPRLDEVNLSGGVLLFACGISIVTGVLFGLAPALQATNLRQIESLREGGRGSGSSQRQTRLSRRLVASEIALSLILLICAGLLIRSFQHLLDQNPGFEPRSVLTTRIWMPVPNDPNADPYHPLEKRAAFVKEVIRRISALPGVSLAGIGSDTSLPMGPQRNRSSFVIQDRPAESEEAPVAEVAQVTPEVFPILHVPLIAGRFFTDSDDSKTAPVAIIDASLAHRYWPSESPLGYRIQIIPIAPDSPWVTIVGVVGDIKSEGLDATIVPHIYFPQYQSNYAALAVYLQTGASPRTLGDAIRREVQAVDPNIPVFGTRTMSEVISMSLTQRRFALRIMGIFALIALLLASVGVYGAMAYSIAQRTHEIGVRVALGAQQRDILRMAVGEGFMLVLSGIISGLIGAAILARFLSTMLFSVSPNDPFTFVAIPVLLASVALVACYIPAHRATRVDPLVALRNE